MRDGYGAGVYVGEQPGGAVAEAISGELQGAGNQPARGVFDARRSRRVDREDVSGLDEVRVIGRRC